jgi:drug/metabolite transporter (DMT)-like permease
MCPSSSLWSAAFPLLLLVVVQAIFSGYVTLTSAALSSSSSSSASPSPLVFALLRDTLASVLFLGALAGKELRKPPGPQRLWLPRREHFGYLIALGALAVFGTQLLGVLAIRNLSAPVYGFLTPTVPVVTLLASYLFGLDAFRVRNRGSWLKVVGIAITVGGAVFVVGFGEGSSSSSSHGAASTSATTSPSAGIAYVLAQKTCAGTYPLLQHYMLSRFGYPSFHMAAWAYASGTVLVGMAVSVSAVSADDWRLDAVSAGAVAYSGLLGAFFNYAAMAYVNKRTSPVTVIAFYPLQSLLTPLFAALFLGADIATTDMVGGAIIVVGLLVCLAGMRTEEGGSMPAAAAGVVVVTDTAEAGSIVLTVKDVKDLLAAADTLALEGGGGGRGGQRGERRDGGGGGGTSPGLFRPPSLVLPSSPDNLGNLSESGENGVGASAAAARRRLQRAETLSAVAGPILDRALRDFADRLPLPPARLLSEYDADRDEVASALGSPAAAVHDALLGPASSQSLARGYMTTTTPTPGRMSSAPSSGGPATAGGGARPLRREASVFGAFVT